MADRRCLRRVGILKNEGLLFFKPLWPSLWGALRAPLGDLGTLWGHFGATLGRLGSRLVDLGTLQGHFGDRIVPEYRFS